MPEREDRPRLLWVTEEAPDHTGGGGSIRQAYLFDALAAVFAVDLLVAGVVRDERVRAAAASVIEVGAGARLWTERPIGRRLLGLAITLGSRYPLHAYLSAPRRRALAREIGRRRERYAAVCVEHEALVPLLPQPRPERWIVTLHALYSEIIRCELGLADRGYQRWFWRRELRKAHRLEREALDYELCVVCSREDAEALARVGGGSRESITVIPNGVDLDRLRPTPVPTEPRVLFPATLSYQPNAEAAVWFCTEIWPRIRAAVPDAAVVLAGRAPGPTVRELGRLPGVTVHADVPSMTPYFEAARVVVVPVRVGAGTRLKALDAMAMARPVVGTTIGLEGLRIVEDRQAFVADTPEAFAAAVVETLQSDELARAMGAAGRDHVERGFGWDRIGQEFTTAVSELARDHGTAVPGDTARYTS
jgi:glycosyltransferase involved in cell wall biosynthesis